MQINSSIWCIRNDKKICKNINQNIVFRHPVGLIFSSITHCTSVHHATRLLFHSVSTIRFARTRPSSSHYSLQLFHCVICETSRIICKCGIFSHLKNVLYYKLFKPIKTSIFLLGCCRSLSSCRVWIRFAAAWVYVQTKVKLSL
jgi:hypothetical protein